MMHEWNRGCARICIQVRIWAALVIAVVLAATVARPISAEDFGPTKVYDTTMGDDGDSDDHTLHDAGTEIIVTGSGTYELGGTISGTGDLIKRGSGTLYLSQVRNTYTGDTKVYGGTLEISDGLSINASTMDNVVSGAGSQLIVNGNLYAGYSGNGAFTITDGGMAISRQGTILIGLNSGYTGTVNVRGTGSIIAAEHNTGSILVGIMGEGILNLSDGGKATTVNNNIGIAIETGSTGTVTIDGVGSTLTAGGNGKLTVGSSGTGSFSLANGGKAITEGGNIEIASKSGSTGKVVVDGPASEMRANKDLNIGIEGSGSLALHNGARVSTETGGIFIGAQDNDSTFGMARVGFGAFLESAKGIDVGWEKGRGELSGSGTVTAGEQIRVRRGSVLSAGDNDGEIDTLKITALGVTLEDGSILRVDGKGSTADVIAVTGNVTIGNGGATKNLTIDLSRPNVITNASILTASSGLTTRINLSTDVTYTFKGESLTVGSTVGRSVFDGATLNQSGNVLNLTTSFSLGESKIVEWIGLTDANWDWSTSGNWTDGSRAVVFQDGDSVVFRSGAKNTDITLVGRQIVSRMDVTGGTYSFTGNISGDESSWIPGSGPIPADLDGGLHISGNGTHVTLNGDNGFKAIDIAHSSGATNTLILKTNASAGNATITNRGLLEFDFASGTVANSISGDGDVVVKAGDTITFTGKNKKDYAGKTTVTSGTLMTGTEYALSKSSHHYLEGCAALDLNGTDQTIAGLTGSSDTSVRLGSDDNTGLKVGKGSFAGGIHGSGNFAKIDSGNSDDNTLILSGNNSYIGGTFIESGTLSLTGTLSDSTRLIIEDGTFELNRVGEQIVSGLAGFNPTSQIRLVAGSRLTVNNDTESGHFGFITGEGSLTKSGTGSLILSGGAGTSTYSGNTLVAAGELKAGGANSLSGLSVFEIMGGALLNLDNNHQIIAGLSGDSGSLVDLGNAYLTVDQKNASTTTTFRGALFGNSASSFVKDGLGTQVFDNATLDDFKGTWDIRNGALRFNTSGHTLFTNGLNCTTEGTVAFDLGSRTNELIIVASGSNLAGTLDLIRGSVNLDVNMGPLLSSATLRLRSEASAKMFGNRSMKSLVFDGGQFTISNSNNNIPSSHLTVDELSVTGNGGAVQVTINNDIHTTVANYGNFYDYSSDASTYQQALIKANNTVGPLSQLTLVDSAGDQISTTPKAVTRKIQTGGIHVGNAVFDYIASVSDGSTGADKGVFLGYGLKQLESLPGQTIVLDSSDAVVSPGTPATLTAQLTGDGGFEFKGTTPSAVGNFNSSYTGSTVVDNTSVYLLTNNSFGYTSSLELRGNSDVHLLGVKQKIGDLSSTSDQSSIHLGWESLRGELTLEDHNDTTFGGELAGFGDFIKTGSKTLTLTKSSYFEGTADIQAGTLALSGSGSLRATTLRLGSTAAFDIAAAGNPVSVAGFKVAKDSTLIAGSQTLDLSGKKFVLDIDGAGDGDTILTVVGNGSNSLKVDEATTVSLLRASITLQKDNAVILAQSLTSDSTVTDDILTSGRRKFSLGIDQSRLVATVLGTSSFVDATNEYLAAYAPGNANIQSGGAYLDWLVTQPFGSTDAMTRLDDFYTTIVDTMDVATGNWELQRFYGAHGAYAATALQVATSRFQPLWQGLNRQWLDQDLFAGIASDQGLASPIYPPRDCVPVGRSQVWASGFGSWAEQDSRNGLAGYKFDAYGGALGYEYSAGRFNFGTAAGYSRGKLKIDDLLYNGDSDILNLAVYAAYAHESGFYAEAGFGYGHAWNDYTVRMLSGGQGRKRGDFGSDNYSANAELGYIARLGGDANLIPSVGIEYNHLRTDAWSEDVSGDAGLTGNRFATGRDNSLAVPLGLRVNTLFRIGCGDSHIIPEVRAAWVYQANRSRPSVNSGFIGAPGGSTMVGVDSGTSHWRIGAGLTGRVNNRVDLRLDYEFTTRSGYRGHNLNAAVGVSF